MSDRPSFLLFSAGFLVAAAPITVARVLGTAPGVVDVLAEGSWSLAQCGLGAAFGVLVGQLRTRAETTERGPFWIHWLVIAGAFTLVGLALGTLSRLFVALLAAPAGYLYVRGDIHASDAVASLTVVGLVWAITVDPTWWMDTWAWAGLPVTVALALGLRERLDLSWHAVAIRRAAETDEDVGEPVAEVPATNSVRPDQGLDRARRDANVVLSVGLVSSLAVGAARWWADRGQAPTWPQAGGFTVALVILLVCLLVSWSAWSKGDTSVEAEDRQEAADRPRPGEGGAGP